MISVRVLALCALLPSLFISTGCADDSTECSKGETCACSGAGTCTWDCVDAGCAFSANGQGAASLTCPEGGCTLTASGQGATTLACAGGGCTVTANGQGDVNVPCAGGGCAVTCAGQGACHITGCPTCTCTEAAITASCTVE
jgi:hypothetical protein